MNVRIRATTQSGNEYTLENFTVIDGAMAWRDKRDRKSGVVYDMGALGCPMLLLWAQGGEIKVRLTTPVVRLEVLES